ncbi:MAG: electron transfer flavoprotein, partial [Desulfobacteraceae bacterium]
MNAVLHPPAYGHLLSIPATVIYTVIPIVGVALFGYLIYNRMKPLLKAAPDHRFDDLAARLRKSITIWLLQKRQPRYMVAGVLHILLFAGFLLLGLRSLELIFVGIIPGFTLPGM